MVPAPNIFMLLKRIEKLEAQSEPELKFKKLRPEARIPEYAKPGDAGMDLKACIDNSITLMPEQKVVVPTGLAMELPVGFEAQVRSRSGLSVKGLVVGNSPGTIDSGYRGEVCVILHNHGGMITVHPGDRIAQMVIARVCSPNIRQVDELEGTDRGIAGFGSTGV